MAAQGTVAVKFVGDVSGLKRSVGEAESSLAGVGRTLTHTLTPAAIGVGAVFASAFSEFDKGADTIRAQTGATGDALDDLVDSMKDVGGKVTQPLSEVGQVMGELHQRTGLTGDALETMTKQLLDLQRVGNDASAETITRVFGDWGIAAEDSSDALDKLFRASQATGPSVDRLGQLIVQYGAPLRQLGFGFEESAAMLGKFEKEGVNTELVMGSMRVALGKLARSGEDAESTFQRVVGEIKNAGSASEANAIALELFGARAGPDMAAAIREGRFELGELITQVESGTETISQAAADTADWGDKFAMLKNRLDGVIGPIGEVGMGVAGLAAGLGPAITGVSKMTDFLKNNALAVTGVTAALGIAGVAVYSFMKSKEEAARLVAEFTSAIKADSGALGENTEAMLTNKLQGAELMDELVSAGLDIRDVTAAINNETGARDRLKAALLEQGVSMAVVKGVTGDLISAGEKSLEQVRATELATARMNAEFRRVPDRIDTKVGFDDDVAVRDIDAYKRLLQSIPQTAITRAEFHDANRFQNQQGLSTAQSLTRGDSGGGDERAVSSAIDGINSLEDANRSLTIAEQKLDEVRADGTATAEMLREAEDNLEAAQLRVVSAQRSANQAMDDLLAQGPAALQNFTELARAAGLEADEVARLLVQLERLSVARAASIVDQAFRNTGATAAFAGESAAERIARLEAEVAAGRTQEDIERGLRWQVQHGSGTFAAAASQDVHVHGAVTVVANNPEEFLSDLRRQARAR